MKKLIFFLSLSFAFFFAVRGMAACPVSDNLPEVPASYKDTHAWRVHRACKISGFTALGVGGSMMIVGFVGDVLANYESPSYNPGFRIVGCVGAGVTAASIPLFALAVKNRQKAENAALGTQLDPEQWKKYKRFRIGACTSLGVGLTAMLIGAATGAFDDSYYKKTGAKISFYSGAVLTVGSIPLFVLAQRQKQAAWRGGVSVSVGSTALAEPLRRGMVGTRPALALQFRF